MSTSSKIRDEKVKVVEELKEKFASSQIIVLTNYRGDDKAHGLTVKEISKFRNKVKASGGEYTVIKNTLARIALEQLGITEISEFLVSPTAIVMGYKDPVATAKAIVEFKKESTADRNHLPVVKAIYMNGKTLPVGELENLSKVPPREVLLAQLLSCMEGPLQNLVNIFIAPVRDLVGVLDAVKAKKEEGNN